MQALPCNFEYPLSSLEKKGFSKHVATEKLTCQVVRTEKAVFVTGSKLEILLSNYYAIQTSVKLTVFM